jgi:hypothetical protein
VKSKTLTDESADRYKNNRGDVLASNTRAIAIQRSRKQNVP